MTTPDIAEARRLADIIWPWAPNGSNISEASQAIRALADELERLRAQVAPAGWTLVPVEPTPEMVKAGQRAGTYNMTSPSLAQRYRAMIAASPAAPAQQAAPSLTVGDVPELPPAYGFAWHEGHFTPGGPWGPGEYNASFGFSTDSPPDGVEAADLYTSDQMRDYARATLAAQPAAQAEPVASLRSFSTQYGEADDSGPDEYPAWPIAKLTVAEDGSVSACLYAPGLPDGEFDVFLEPPSNPPAQHKDAG